MPWCQERPRPSTPLPADASATVSFAAPRQQYRRRRDQQLYRHLKPRRPHRQRRRIAPDGQRPEQWHRLQLYRQRQQHSGYGPSLEPLQYGNPQGQPEHQLQQPGGSETLVPRQPLPPPASSGLTPVFSSRYHWSLYHHELPALSALSAPAAAVSTPTKPGTAATMRRQP